MCETSPDLLNIWVTGRGSHDDDIVPRDNYNNFSDNESWHQPIDGLCQEEDAKGTSDEKSLERKTW